MEAIHQLILIVLAFGAVQHVESVCRPPPLWLFSLPEDIEPIFSGLTCKCTAWCINYTHVYTSTEALYVNMIVVTLIYDSQLAAMER